MQVIEVRPGVFLRIRPEDVKRFGLGATPQEHKAAAPAAVKKAAKKAKPAEPVIEEGEADAGDN